MFGINAVAADFFAAFKKENDLTCLNFLSAIVIGITSLIITKKQNPQILKPKVKENCNLKSKSP